MAPAASAPVAPLDADDIDRNLAARRWHLQFAPSVERRYEHDTAPGRRRELVTAGLLALLVFNLFLINDRLVRPEVLGTAIAWRSALSLPGGVILWLVHRGMSARWREWAMASTLVMATISASEIVSATTSAFAAYDPFVFSLIVVAGNIGFPLRFVQSLVASALSVAAMSIIVLPSPNLPRGAALFAVGLMAGGAVFTVTAARRTEILVRRTYLLMLRESLRGDAAARDAATFAELSNTDPLTGVANRRAFEQQLADRWAIAIRDGAPLGVLMIDIDNFKRYNDEFGHPSGDACLCEVAAVFQAHLRGRDFVARIGGEEFVAVLPGADAEQASIVAERLRRAVEQRMLPHDGVAGQDVVTVSIGVAATPDHASTTDQLLAAADRGLYEAKYRGRNRAVIADAAPGDLAAASTTVAGSGDAKVDALR